MSRAHPWPLCRSSRMGLPFGASPPMRMTASWSPTRTGRPNTRLLRMLYAPPRQASSPLIKLAVYRTDAGSRSQVRSADHRRSRDRRSSSSRLAPAAPLRFAPSGDDAHRSRRVGWRADQDGLCPPARRAQHPPREPPATRSLTASQKPLDKRSPIQGWAKLSPRSGARVLTLEASGAKREARKRSTLSTRYSPLTSRSAWHACPRYARHALPSLRQ